MLSISVGLHCCGNPRRHSEGCSRTLNGTERKLCHPPVCSSVLENGDEIKYMMTNAPRTPTPTSIERHEAPPQLYARRVVGREVWKAEALLTEGGEAIGYVQRRRRVCLGMAMGAVKDDH
jgi:hypothetical protein